MSRFKSSQLHYIFQNDCEGNFTILFFWGYVEYASITVVLFRFKVRDVLQPYGSGNITLQWGRALLGAFL